MRTSLSCLLVVACTVAFAHLTAAQRCNCPGAAGTCFLNCSAPTACCGSGTMDPTCYSSSTAQCCEWYLASTTCTMRQSCCGEMGYGASSNAFCCSEGSSCCKTSGDGMSSCCRAGQTCCGGYNTYCCDAATEKCDDTVGACVPIAPLPPPGPNPQPGQPLWYADLGGSAQQPALYNSTHLVASGLNTYIIERASGRMQLLANTSYTFIAPIVKGHLAFVCGNYRNTLYVADVNENKLLWSSSASYCDPLQVANGVVIAGGLAFRARDGKVLWSVNNAGVVAVSPDGNIAYVMQTDFSNQYAFSVQARDARSGTLLFKVSGVNEWQGNQPFPVLVDGVLVCPDYTGYDARTGVLRWRLTGAFNATANPVDQISGSSGVVVFSMDRVSLAAVNATSGKVMWTTTTIDYFEICLVTDAMVFLCGSNPEGNPGNDSALAISTGKVLWQTSYPAGTASNYPATLHDGVLYVPALGGVHTAGMNGLDAATGKVIKSWSTDALLNGGVTIGARALYYGTANTYVTAVELLK